MSLSVVVLLGLSLVVATQATSGAHRRRASAAIPRGWRQQTLGDAMMRKDEPFAPQENQLTRSIKRHKLKTQVGELARYFEPVIKGRGLLREIDVVRLLKACKHFEVSMRKVGQRQSAKDLSNNIKKVEKLFHIAPRKDRHSMSALLRFEKGMGIHGPHGHLKDPSGAIGLLWIRRSIDFQYRMYKQILETQRGPVEAAMIAYHLELQPFHAWPLQRLYSVAMKTMMPETRESLLARIGGFDENSFGPSEEQATKRDLQELLDVWRPLLVRWKQIYAQLDLEDRRRV